MKTCPNCELAPAKTSGYCTTECKAAHFDRRVKAIRRATRLCYGLCAIGFGVAAWFAYRIGAL